MEKIKEVIKKHSSNNSSRHMLEISKYHTKLSRKAKQNEYLRIRDLIVIGLTMVQNGLDYIPSVQTSECGRAKLYELKQGIIEAFKEIE